MSMAQSFFALAKLYCSINVLLVPRAYVNGGYLGSTLIIIVSVAFQAISAIKLTTVGNKINKISYPDIVKHAFGIWGKRFVEICLALIHFQFTIAHLSFCM